MAFPFYDTNNHIIYKANPSESPTASREPLPLDVIVNISFIVEPHTPATYTFAFDGYAPGYTFAFEKTVRCLADLINNWNMFAVKFNYHTLVMSPDPENTGHVYITNISDMPVHVWAGPSGYQGGWAPHQTRSMVANDFLTGAPHYMYLNAPVLIAEDTPMFEVTAYLYRKTKEEFYTKTETICAPMGFYTDITDLIAVMNARIQMRGERNGYVFQFSTRRTKTGEVCFGIKASHRQPEPSFARFQPYASAIVFGMSEEAELPLRTNKQMFFRTM